MKMTKKTLFNLVSGLMYFFLLSGITLTSCKDDNEEKPNTIVDVAAANTDFDLLETALIKAGLDDDLKATGPFTVFAPTDAAFIAYLGASDENSAKTAINSLSGNDLTNLTNVLLYHVAAGKTLSTALTNNQSIATLLAGNSLTVIINGSQISIRDNNLLTTDANVVTANVNASNGVIHAIDKVLVPTQASITQIVVANSDFDILEAAVVRAGLATELGGTTAYTVFAPTDAAFITYISSVLNVNVTTESAAITAVNSLPANTLADILRYHVVSGNVKAADLTTGTNVAVSTIRTTNNSVYVTKTASPLTVSVNGATVTTADVSASNGTIHIVNQVIVPPAGTVVATAQADARFSTLVAAVVKTGLTDALNGAGPLTVFAPTNDAFSALPITQFRTAAAINALDPNNSNDLALINTLREVLRYHVVSARAFSSNLTNNQNLTTLKADSPNTVVIGIGSGVTVDGAGSAPSNVIIPNFTTTNGVIHVIDRVLLFQ
jgi:transforming growth factor-beta-induced protein